VNLPDILTLCTTNFGSLPFGIGSFSWTLVTLKNFLSTRAFKKWYQSPNAAYYQFFYIFFITYLYFKKFKWEKVETSTGLDLRFMLVSLIICPSRIRVKELSCFCTRMEQRQTFQVEFWCQSALLQTWRFLRQITNDSGTKKTTISLWNSLPFLLCFELYILADHTAIALKQ